jgi:sn-glycerol 3-phosphate transport system permease protein
MRWTARDARELGVGLLFLLPSLALFVAFVFYPLGKTVYLSLFYSSPTGRLTAFAGLDQYTELLISPVFRSGLQATFLLALYTVPAGIALALLLAVLANRRVRGINVFRTMLSSTIAVSAAVGSLIWLLLFNPSLGLLNYVLSLVGVPPLAWLTEPSVAILAVSVATIWLTLGFSIIVLLAGVQSVPEELYEAARIDGASPRLTFLRITFPLMGPYLFFLLVVNTIAVFQAFTQIHLLTRGGPVDSTRTLVYSIYLDAFQNFQFAYASAQSLVLFLIVLALTLIQFRFVERRVHYQ